MNIFHFQKLEVADIYSTSLINNLLPMYILNIIMIPLFFIGALVSNTMFNINSTMNENKLLNNTEITNNSFYKSPFFIFITIGLLMIILIVLKIYSTKIDTIPIMGLFLDDVNNIGELRSDATNNFDGKKYRYNLILQTFPLFLFVFYFLLFNKKLFQKIIIIILFFLCMFTSIMDGVKSPLLQFFLLILLLIFFNNKKIPIKTIIIFSLVALLSMGLMYAFFMGMAGRDLSDILMAPFNRIFLGSAMPMIYYLDYVPNYTDYLYGQSFPNPAGIFPFEWRRITVEIMSYAHPELISRGIVGSMPATFYGEFYLNFGYIGSIFSMIFLGFLLKTIDNIFIITINKNSFLLPFLALFFIYIHIAGTFSRTTFMGIFFNANLIVLTFISILFIFFNITYIQFRRSFAKKSNINSIK